MSINLLSTKAGILQVNLLLNTPIVIYDVIE